MFCSSLQSNSPIDNFQDIVPQLICFGNYFPIKMGRRKPPNLWGTWRLDSGHFMKMSRQFLLYLLPLKSQKVSTFSVHLFHIQFPLTRCPLFLLLFFHYINKYPNNRGCRQQCNFYPLQLYFNFHIFQWHHYFLCLCSHRLNFLYQRIKY